MTDDELDVLGHRAAEVLLTRAQERSTALAPPSTGLQLRPRRDLLVLAGTLAAVVALAAVAIPVLGELPRPSGSFAWLVPDERSSPEIEDGRELDPPAEVPHDPETDDGTEPGEHEDLPRECGGLLRTVGVAGSRWSVQVQHAGVVTAPVVSDDLVLAGTNAGDGPLAGCTFGLEADSGEVRWSVEGPLAPFTLPVVADGLAITTVAGEVVAVDAEDGAERWRREVGAMSGPGTLAVHDDLLFVSSRRTLQAVELATGTPRWQREDLAGAPVHGVVDGELLLSTEGFTALDPATGQDRSGSGLASTYLMGVVGERVIGEAPPNTLRTADRRTGEAGWELNVPGSRSTAPVVVDELLVLAADDGAAYGIEVDTGSIRWRTEIDLPLSSRTRPVVVPGSRELHTVDGAVLVPTRRGLVLLDGSDGTPRWSTDLGRVVVPPLPRGDGTIVVAVPHRILLVDLADGAVLEELSPVPGTASRYGALLDDRVVFRGRSRTLYGVPLS